jgi:hypothetical protein
MVLPSMLHHQMALLVSLTLTRKSWKGSRHTLYKNNTLPNSASKHHPYRTVTHIYRPRFKLHNKDLLATSTPTPAKKKSTFWLPRRATRTRNVLICLQYLLLLLMAFHRLKVLKSSLSMISGEMLHHVLLRRPSRHQQNNLSRVPILGGTGIWTWVQMWIQYK